MIEQVVAILKSISLPFAYDHFAEGEAPSTPFICYLTPSSDNLAADGSVYYKISECRIELYTDKKDPETESLVETALTEAGIYYDKSEVWIESESLYEVAYSFEIGE